MPIEVWQEIPAVADDDLRPILSTMSDSRMEAKVTAELGLSREDSLFSELLSNSRSFGDGRLIVVNALQPIAVQRRVEADLSAPTDVRWLRAADYTLKLTAQQSQTCYGGWRDSFVLRVFG